MIIWLNREKNIRKTLMNFGTIISFDEKLHLQDIKEERAHRVIKKCKKRTRIAKFAISKRQTKDSCRNP